MTNLTTASLTPVTDDLTTNDFIPTTYTINETEIEKDEGDGMPGGAMAAMIIGIIAGIVIIVFVAFFVISRYRKKQKEKTAVYKHTVDKLNLNKCPSPSELEGAEIRPPNRKKGKGKKPEIENDLQFSDKHYVNEKFSDPKYENVNNSNQPIYLEPKQGGTLTYHTADRAHGETEYYVVDNEKSTPSLPSREDTNAHVAAKNGKVSKGPPKPKTAKGAAKSDTKETKSKESKSSSRDSDSEPEHSAKDYVNMKDQNIKPPEGRVRRPKATPQQTLNVKQDDVYENEEIPKSPRTKTTKR